MKRRGFLGFLAGGSVAGPGMVKQAASATLADMSLQGLTTGGMGMQVPEIVDDSYNDYPTRIAKLALRSQAEHRERQRQQYVGRLDPDLATFRSFALHTKIRVQKRRDYWRGIENEKSWLQRRIEGIFDW
jgi:hypothetical protein